MKNKQLLIATNNKGKRAELLELLRPLQVEVLTPADLGLELDVEENGETYDANACLKAEAFLHASGLISLADDTGLEVDALGGRPGVHSARYVERPGATDAERRAKLLFELRAKAQPWTAHFHCTVAVAAPGRDIMLFQGNVYGKIVEQESGDFGFGYDRLFWIEEMGKTLAACTMEEKNHLSHRALAVQQALPYLKELFNSE